MSSLPDILSMSLEIERKSRDMYLDTADRVRDPVAKSVLAALANDEIGHEEVIYRYYDAVRRQDNAPAPDIDAMRCRLGGRASKILHDISEDLMADPGYYQVYEAARKLEMEGRDFYAEHAAAATTPSVGEFFKFLARLEQIHFETLDVLLEATRRAAEVR